MDDKNSLDEQRSMVSSRSIRSSRSSTASAVTARAARAHAKAAQACVIFAKKELAMKKEKADDEQFFVIDEWTQGEEFAALPSPSKRPAPQSAAPNHLGTTHTKVQHLKDEPLSQVKTGNRDYPKLRELGDLLMELMAAKTDGYLPGLTYLDTARGINPIVEKLPHPLQEKWISVGSKFKEDNNMWYPPFSFFTHFIYRKARIRNYPAFALSSFSSAPPKYERSMSGHVSTRMPVSVHKMDVTGKTDSSTDAAKREVDPGKQCPIHYKPHPLTKCRVFRNKTIEECKAYLKDNGLCFRCCASVSHTARECKTVLRCRECESIRHSTAMHPGPAFTTERPVINQLEPEDERKGTPTTAPLVSSTCTEVCGQGLMGRSCSKICLVRVYPRGQHDRTVNMYAILDDQSNRSLARPDLFDIFSIKSSPAPYSLRTCAGLLEMTGRKAEGFCVEAVSGGVSIDLPSLIDCSQIPNNRLEIPTPEAALHHAHLKVVATHIPPLDSNAQILLLLGRDVVRVHKVREQVNGPHDAPFAQRLDLGWVLVGDVCLGQAHKPDTSAFKTSMLESGRPTFLTPCPSHIHVRERTSYGGEKQDGFSYTAWRGSADNRAVDQLGYTVFEKTKDDNKSALSFEDKAFMSIMEKECHKDEANSWLAPLPFKVPRLPLPNNCDQALLRLASLRRTLDRKPEMKGQFIAFMEKVFESNHAELAPSFKLEKSPGISQFSEFTTPRSPVKLG
ncbi:hypothetical protein SKAU_G00244370 [Synaphobranchus kaupii]|uniref:Uncharacterized protein n=1 Tax=Synaphobranchus kaupii TaxID=118154 RepID=A0A9Q1F1Z4_SYNKA|nr:hypothetical protein SKAU_G00244370 [Synaphobranchus kaupii]